MAETSGEIDRGAGAEPVDDARADSPVWTLESLYRAFFDEVRHYVANRFGAGPPAPEDVAQQAFVRLAAGGEVDRIRNPRAFLMQSARNLVIDEHRRAAVRHSAAVNGGQDIQEQSDDRDPERVLSARERLAVVRTAIEAMPAPRRRSFLMHRVSGLSFAEIARQTGYSESGVKKHVTLALEDVERAVAAADGEKEQDDQ